MAAKKPPPDDIREFFPHAESDEIAAREKIRSAFNVANFGLLKCQDGLSLDILHCIIAAGLRWRYADLPPEQLQRVVSLCRHLWRAHQEAERLEAGQ